MNRALAVLFFLTFSPMVAAQPVQRVLVPIVTDHPLFGVGDSRFTSTLYAYSTAANGVTFQLGPSDLPVEVHSGLNQPLVTNGLSGRILSTTGDADAVAWRLVLLSGSTTINTDTSFLPVAHERDWHRGVNVLPLIGGIYPDSQSRATLRIYLFDEPPPGFQMTVAAEASMAPLDNPGSFAVTTFTRSGTDASYPWYAGVSLTNRFTFVRCRFFDYACYGDISLRLIPNDPSIRYWALFSMTNNTNQTVLLDWTR